MAGGAIEFKGTAATRPVIEEQPAEIKPSERKTTDASDRAKSNESARQSALDLQKKING